LLTLRLQRNGRKKLAQYRLVAQEHRVTPSSGKVSAYLGSYNPHTKDFNFKKEEVEKHLANGAQPSNRVAILLQKAGVKLPAWVTITQKPEKKKPEPAKEEATPEPVADEAPAEADQPATETEASTTEDTASEEVVAEADTTADEESK